MPTTPDERRHRATMAHDMVRRIVGRAPEGLVAQCYLALAEGAYSEVARSVVDAARTRDVSLTQHDLALLVSLAAAVDAPLELLGGIEVGEDDRPPFRFTATAADLDGSHDEVDRAAVRSVRSQTGVAELWGAWRHPADGSPWPPPRRVYLLEVELSCDLAAVTTRLRRDLAFAGERDGQVEVHLAGTDYPDYHRRVRAAAARLWPR